MLHVVTPPALVLEDSFMTASVSEGIPFEEIVREARRRRADLIVMGTHGRTGVARLILGSVASRVLALAACSVLTVRGR